MGIDVGDHGDAVEERSPERKLPVEPNRDEEIDLGYPEHSDYNQSQKATVCRDTGRESNQFGSEFQCQKSRYHEVDGKSQGVDSLDQ